MRVFVVGTGRCGTLTYANACAHIDGYTVGHEGNVGRVGTDRLYYPDSHIEVDNRLSWYIPRLRDLYGAEALFIHLQRDPFAVVDSFMRRPGSTALRGYATGVLVQDSNWQDKAPAGVVSDYVDTMRALIAATIPKGSITIDIETPDAGFRAMCDLIGADVDMSAALATLRGRYNEG